MKKVNLLKIAALFAISSPSFAHPSSENGLFLGLGGSYNSVNLHQSITATGISNVFTGSTLVQYGSAGGPTVDLRQTDGTLAPVAQFGVVHAFGNCFWGVKFWYDYLDLTLTDAPVNLPQSGTTYTVSPPTTSSLIGNAVIESAQTLVNHEFTLLLYFGQKLNQNDIYLGVGPALFLTKTYFNNFIGFANIGGVPANVTGNAVSFSESKGVWGGAAQIGYSHHLGCDWVVDLCYSFAVSARFSGFNEAPFINTVNSPAISQGSDTVSNSQRVISHALGFTINKLFFI